jgi:hypothetical protein
MRSLSEFNASLRCRFNRLTNPFKNRFTFLRRNSPRGAETHPFLAECTVCKNEQSLLIGRSLQPERSNQTPNLPVLEVHLHPFLLVLAADLARGVLAVSAQEVDARSKGGGLGLGRREDRGELGNEVA